MTDENEHAKGTPVHSKRPSFSAAEYNLSEWVTS